MLLDFGVSLFKGILLGSSLCVIGYILDYTISLESQERIVKEKTDYFLQAHKHIIYNLIGISPVVYAFVDNILLTTLEEVITTFYSIGRLTIDDLILLQEISHDLLYYT